MYLKDLALQVYMVCCDIMCEAIIDSHSLQIENPIKNMLPYVTAWPRDAHGAFF